MVNKMKTPSKHYESSEEIVDDIYGITTLPWKSKAEWLNVYNKAYSGNLSDEIEAYNIMLEWQGAGDCPLGIMCTRIILQGVIKDKVFHSDVTHSLADEDLQYIYGGSIMRFLNYLGSKDVALASGEDNVGSETLFVKARKFGIPDWIVNVRHTVSHGINLPEIGMLRLCINYLLKFLKTNYWEIENVKLQDIVLERPREETLKEHIIKLLNLYVIVKEQQKLGRTMFNSIKNHAIREEISRLEEYRLVTEQMKNAPWEIDYRNRNLMNPIKIKTSSLNVISLQIIRLIVEYNSVDDIFNMWNIIASYILQDTIKHKKVRLGIWGRLVKGVAARGHVKSILEPFMDFVFNEQNDYNVPFWGKKWLIVLLQALLKRAKVRRLKLALSGKINMKKWEQKVILSLSPLERDHLKQLIVRSKNNKSKQIKLNIYNLLCEIVEKYYKQLKSALRFKCHALDSTTVSDYMYRVCRKPNEFTPTAFDFLINMLDDPSFKSVHSVKALLNIYQGNKRSGKKSKGAVFTVNKLVEKLEISEEEFQEWKMKAHPPPDSRNESIDDLNTPDVNKLNATFNKDPIFKSKWPTFLEIPWKS